MTFPEWIDISARTHGGVTKFCKRVGIERESFYDYIQGKVMPSKKTMQKIIGFVGSDNIPDDVIRDYHDRVELFRLRTPHSKSTSTLCWYCVNAVPDMEGHGCSWSSRLIPVEGWTAIKTNLSTLSSYHVKKCPLFVSDGQGITEDNVPLGDYDSGREARMRDIEADLIAKGLLKSTEQYEKEMAAYHEKHIRDVRERNIRKRSEINAKRRQKREQLKTEDPARYKEMLEKEKRKAAEHRAREKAKKQNG